MCAHTIAAYINIVRFLDNPSQHWFQKDRRKQTHMIDPQSIVAHTSCGHARTCSPDCLTGTAILAVLDLYPRRELSRERRPQLIAQLLCFLDHAWLSRQCQSSLPRLTTMYGSSNWVVGHVISQGLSDRVCLYCHALQASKTT